MKNRVSFIAFLLLFCLTGNNAAPFFNYLSSSPDVVSESKVKDRFNSKLWKSGFNRDIKIIHKNEKVKSSFKINPVADAGKDITVYLSQTNTFQLDGSGSQGDSFEWRDISSDYKSGAIISDPYSKVTTVTNIEQGTWYYELSATADGITKRDTVMVTVNVSSGPAGYNLYYDFKLDDPNMLNVVNIRDDTTQFFGWINDGSNNYKHIRWKFKYEDGTNGQSSTERGKLTLMMVDSLRGKFYSSIEDGWPWLDGGTSYCRAEVPSVTLDSNYTYVFEWKGYYPQPLNFDKQNGEFLTIFQVHPTPSVGTLFQFSAQQNGYLWFLDNMTADWKNNVSTKILPLSDLYNKTHTLRITIREGKGYPGQDAFVKVELDGVQKYYRNTGIVGLADQQDYAKFAGLYDFNNVIVSASNKTRKKRVSLVTEGFKVYRSNQVGTAPNKKPVANAGPDQTVTLPANTVSLAGSGSDPDGSIVSYQWTKITGPASYNIVNPKSATTDVSGLVQGIYQFQLAVTDDKGALGYDTAMVTVNAESNNKAPVASAGPDITIDLPVNTASLTGSGSDSDGSVTSYLWTKISGPSSFNIVNPKSAVTDVSGLVQGVYQFQLTVTDNKGATGSDIVQVTVNAAPNKVPVANAGADQTITLPINTISLAGSGTDSDGTISSYQWTKISGPSSFNIVNPKSAVTDVSGLVQGVYQFQLTVTDNKGATGSSTMKVTVNPAANQPPVATVGPVQTITLPTNTVSIEGSGTDPDGSIASYQWTKISGPSSFNILNPKSAVTEVSGLVQGVYQFQLTVTDNSGATGSATTKVTVNPAPNQPPVANAGSDQNITLPVNTVSLAGGGFDPDGSIVSYQWAKISGPSAFNIVNSKSAVTDVSGLVEGVYQFQLTVTDNNGDTGSDTIEIAVNPAPNKAPVSNAGPDQTITLPANTVSLAGSGSDSDGSVVSYQWIKISGPSGYNIVNPNSAATDVSGLVQGVYQFQLTVTDNDGASNSDIMKVTVNSAANKTPVANAGANQTITLPENRVTLNGSGTDSDGSIASYQWTQISGPSNYSIANPDSAVTDVSDLVQGSYLFQLTVTDDKGASGSDIVRIIVNPAPNKAPVADAGADQTISLPENMVSLSGSGSDSDGTVTSYRWTKISGPSSFHITRSRSAETNVTGLTEGVYQFQLTVTDNRGATGTDVMKVTVNPAPNKAPVSHAGPDQTITLPTNTISLAGSGSDSDGSVVSYQWTKTSGPSSYNIVNPKSAVTDVSGLVQGVYQFQLTVTDDDGATGSATMKVTVNPAPNKAPIADAGRDQTITLPANTASLAGSGSDLDGTVVSYQWAKISGPSSYNIVNPKSAVTDVSGLVQGVYQFQLTVTDNAGATGSDIVKVTVNAAPNKAPVAKAGPDQTITLPVNTTSLAGSGTDADGSIASYQWTKISGPASFNIVNPKSAVSDVSELVQGVYQFQLTVTDNDGDTGSDIVKVTVLPPNQSPKANAGGNISITLPEDSAWLHGSAADPDGRIVSYMWAQIDGPSRAQILSPDNAETLVKNLTGGSYTFVLSVTDDDGAVGRDTMSLSVNVPRLAFGSTSIQVYPNPTPDVTTLKINEAPEEKMVITIADIQGRMIRKEAIDAGDQKVYTGKLDLSQLRKGLYLVTVRSYTGKIIGSVKVIKLK